MRAPSKDFVWALGLIGVLFVGLLIWGSRPKSACSTTRATRECMNLTEISAAIRNYQSELGGEPPLAPADFFAALRGNNPKGFSFLVPDRYPESKSGIRRDEWGTPYQVFRGTDGLLIRSAGHNKVFDDLSTTGGDDMTVFIPTLTSTKTEPVDAGQPATKPADKVPAKDKPSTPTSKDTPR